MEIHICSITEYDAETRMPTIANPNSSTFYLVPTEDGTSPDLFTEWVYVNGAWEMFGSAKIDLSGYLTDVQIDGTSIVTDGVANVPTATASTFGAIRTNVNYGTLITYSGHLGIATASSAQIKNGDFSVFGNYKAVSILHQHESTFYGLAKSAGADEKDSTLPVGNYTDNAKDKIQTMLGITPLIAPHETDPFESNHVIGELFIINGKLYRAKIALTAGEYINEGTNVEVVNTSDVYVKNTDYADNGKYGLVKLSTLYGIRNHQGVLATKLAGNDTLKRGTDQYDPVVASNANVATFYGLAKASGDTTQSQSDNAVGTYTDDAKSSIQTMLGLGDVVRNTDYCTDNTTGVARTNSSFGVTATSTGNLRISGAASNHVKAGADSYKPITPVRQHESVFYGLTKAAGVDMASSSNAVGAYTDEAKTAIKQMLGVVDSYDSLVVNVEGTDPTITGQPSYRYNCGEVLSLTVTPPETGTIDFRFTSGSSPTVLTLPSTVKMPEWWVEVEANTIYEMCITDGVYCGVMSWAM